MKKHSSKGNPHLPATYVIIGSGRNVKGKMAYLMEQNMLLQVSCAKYIRKYDRSKSCYSTTILSWILRWIFGFYNFPSHSHSIKWAGMQEYQKGWRGQWVEWSCFVEVSLIVMEKTGYNWSTKQSYFFLFYLHRVLIFTHALSCILSTFTLQI